MTGPFDIPEGMPRLEYAIVDEQTQMTRYLAEMAMEDIALLPQPSTRRVRPGGLLDQYRKSAEAELAVEAAMTDAELDAKYHAKVETITMYWAETGEPVEVAIADPHAAEFKG